jgi:hypothetical protein
LQDLQQSTEYITSQFERFDGSGFPAQLAGEDIPIGARILTLASDYDNMQIGTLTQKRLTADEARVIIVHGSGQRYDPRIVNAFIEVLTPSVKSSGDNQQVPDMAVLSPALQPGMVLSRDLITPNGLLMLSVNHVLDAHLIAKIRDFEISREIELTIYIRIVKD